MLKDGKIYIVKVSSGSVWLFKKYRGRFSDKITGCSKAVCLGDMYSNSEIGYIKDANENYLAIWNRVFNDNIELR